jgi:hypothetical protein
VKPTKVAEKETAQPRGRAVRIKKLKAES